jgi:xanthine dehydrogenase YagS FAD-binding subunit
MNRFTYVKATTVAEAINALSADTAARIIAGGTNLVDLLKYDVLMPSTVIDINALPLKGTLELDDGGIEIGALATNAEIAYHPAIKSNFPLLSSAILAGASPQLRNAATTAGNLGQKTRCVYFYDPASPCNKREPGTGCSAVGGLNRMHAILGASEHCIATHPSDMCIALAALDAVVKVHGKDGARDIPFSDFHRLPGDTPHLDNTLSHDEVITSVTVPRRDFGSHHSYVKLRDRQSYAFALVSAAVGLEIEGGVIKRATVAMGGVAHKPWRDTSAEGALVGQPSSLRAFSEFADAFLAGAVGQGENDFKIPLARRLIVRALTQAAEGTPQIQSHKTIN